MMRPKTFLAALAVFVAWLVLDMVIRVVILGEAYEETAQFWRTEEDMKMGLMYSVTGLSAVCFTGIYAWFVGQKNLWSGLFYGLLFGLGLGAGFGFGMYAVMPIPETMAFTWFLGTLVEYLVGGALVGLILKSRPAAEES